MNYLDFIISAQKFGEPRGISSICSAHPFVLEAALRHGQAHHIPVLIETTCNQVNSFPLPLLRQTQMSLIGRI